jgi:hypothetical protein
MCTSCLAASQSEPAEDLAYELDRGQPGASASREHSRRRGNREARTRRRHRHIGGLLLAIRRPPRHERSWQRGSRGEQSVARSLERLTAGGPAIILHDRRMPGGYGNIDHLAVSACGVFVIDAKAVRGKVRVSQPLLGKPKLLINGRNRPRLVDGLDRQVAAVRRALGSTGDGDVPVVGVLCFTRADLPLLGSSRIRGHGLHYPRALARQLNRSGPLARPAIRALARKLASEFPPA